ncbi:endonuclease/exonuclease/phosphatase family protein [Toxoplasma gondii ARI]|uniref:Endonuclease/exonuclease/phosphatase domain-containing protein n=2 Tax=Toxoplasma gondii TaxID=5811 RepID=B9Q954_TOXGV|nr:endonuclease/exonuclease/phosphatase family protein [Toxoplasma gondii VEG]KYF47969.1 endonuclease/exonuclease/phosphatase family protein [Toxoplasma gondii ARI]CEL77458.1 TPA: endonuclease/exonuclease/phosphatase domain-containing protein [Toxoplasma gondii VEG]
MSTHENLFVGEDPEGLQYPTAWKTQSEAARRENGNASSSEATVAAYSANISGSESSRNLHSSLGVSRSASADSSDGNYGPNLRILVLNAYLVPPSISWNPYLWAPFWSCKRPFQRAEDIGRLAAQYDIACLQEVWGTNMAAMNAHVLPTHSILPQTQSGSRFPCVGEIVDPLQFYWRKTGGLWFAWRRRKCAFISMASHYFPFGSQMPLSNQNVTAVELDVSPVFPKHRLIVLNTHFSILGVESRRVNLESVRKFIKELAWKAYLLFLGRQYDAGINAMENLSDLDVAPSFLPDVSMLLCGDFNIDPDRSPRQYLRLRTLDGDVVMRDLFLPEHNPNHAYQYTYYTQETLTEKKKKHSVLRKGNSLYPWPFKGRVDYMFAVDEVRLSSQEVLDLVENFPPEVVVGDDYEEMDIPILKDGALVISFEQIYCLGMDIVAQRQDFELSDHWPLSARITIGAPSIDAKSLPKPRKWQLLRGDSFCVDSSYSGASRYDSKTLTTDRNVADHSKQRRLTVLRDSKFGPADRARFAQEFGYKGRLTVRRQRPAHAPGQVAATAPSDMMAEETIESDEEEKLRWKIGDQDVQCGALVDAEGTQTEEAPGSPLFDEREISPAGEPKATSGASDQRSRVPLAMKRALEVQEARRKAAGQKTRK